MCIGTQVETWTTRIRENVKANVRKLCPSDRKELFRAIKEFKRAPYEFIKALQFHINIDVSGKLVAYGAIIKKRYMAILRASFPEASVVSVVDFARLRKKNAKCGLAKACEILSDISRDETGTGYAISFVAVPPYMITCKAAVLVGNAVHDEMAYKIVPWHVV